MEQVNQEVKTKQLSDLSHDERKRILERLELELQFLNIQSDIEKAKAQIQSYRLTALRAAIDESFLRNPPNNSENDRPTNNDDSDESQSQ